MTNIFVIVYSIKNKTNKEPVWRYYILNLYIENKLFIEEY